MRIFQQLLFKKYSDKKFISPKFVYIQFNDSNFWIKQYQHDI